MQGSGNHGRNNNDSPLPNGVSNLVPSTAPKQSTHSFIAPTSIPIKKTPDITEIIGEGRKEKKELLLNTLNPDFQKAPLVAEEQKSRKAENEEDNMVRNDEKTFLLLREEKVADGGLPPDVGRGDTDFPTHWRTMFDHVFTSVPTIYIPLKESLPEMENNIIKVTVKNDIQKEHFEAKTREVLEFLRTHYDEQIEDIIVETNEQIETKKIIYDVKEKLQNFKEQNPEIDDFLQILELKIKD